MKTTHARARVAGTPLPNSRQERFCVEVASGLTARAAYPIAGYTGDATNSARLHGRAHVHARIAELQTAAAQRAEIDQAYVIRRLVANERKASQAVPVLDHDGKPTGEYTFDAQAVNRSLELIGKQLGMFVTRVDVRVQEALDAFLADLEHGVSRPAYLEVLRFVADRMGVVAPELAITTSITAVSADGEGDST